MVRAQCRSKPASTEINPTAIPVLTQQATVLRTGLWTLARRWDGSSAHDDASSTVAEHSLLCVLAAGRASERKRCNINGKWDRSHSIARGQIISPRSRTGCLSCQIVVDSMNLTYCSESTLHL